MKKQAKRWPIWKIASVTVGLSVAAVVLFWLSTVTDRAVAGLTTNPTGRSAALTPGSFIMMGGVVAGAFGILSAIWLGYRIWELRLPTWERGRKKKRR
jgi:hypothetical protein